eukprot:GHVT01020636.1.p1 GENE.GHVT01020636.1~~GHVT01020636.1.p1  ORF type:complete len:232 (+),score=53.35 GHVT01020636.1:699-1394(+)
MGRCLLVLQDVDRLARRRGGCGVDAKAEAVGRTASPPLGRGPKRFDAKPSQRPRRIAGDVAAAPLLPQGGAIDRAAAAKGGAALPPPKSLPLRLSDETHTLASDKCPSKELDDLHPGRHRDASDEEDNDSNKEADDGDLCDDDGDPAMDDADGDELQMRLLTTILLCLDSVTSSSRGPSAGVDAIEASRLSVVATCSCPPWRLDEALVRAGRLERWVNFCAMAGLPCQHIE